MFYLVAHKPLNNSVEISSDPFWPLEKCMEICLEMVKSRILAKIWMNFLVTKVCCLYNVRILGWTISSLQCRRALLNRCLQQWMIKKGQPQDFQLSSTLYSTNIDLFTFHLEAFQSSKHIAICHQNNAGTGKLCSLW